MSKSKPKPKPKLTADELSIDWLAAAIGSATRSAKFSVSGCLPTVDPQLEIEGLGRIDLPLKRTMKKPLLACCRVAPFGQGTRTLVDETVRKTFELDPRKFRLGDDWNAAITAATCTIAQQLGLPAERLEARLYKLLVYEKGGFFRAHRDSEKQDGMVASLIVVLPNPFEGGCLAVRHSGSKRQFDFKEAAAGQASCFAAFYADCEHQVEPVSHGIRMALAYNLVLQPQRDRAPADVSPAAHNDQLAESLRAWVALHPGRPLVFALEHHYTERGLSLDLLKGADRQLADLVVAMAEKTDFLPHLAQVTRHLSQFADDGGLDRAYSRRSWREPAKREISIGETYEDELYGTNWSDIRGRKQLWNNIKFHSSSIVSTVPIDDWKPTSEEFEGYTGNEGNTLDRWYHRSAIVVWQRDQHYDVVASAGAEDSLPLLLSMTKKLAKTPQKRLAAARQDCVRFARAIVSRWPQRHINHWRSAAGEQSPLNEFPDQLLLLHDREAIAAFLTKLAEQDQTTRINSLVLGACAEFGWNAFAPELKQLLALSPDATRYRQDTILPRDLEWLCGFCCESKATAEKVAVARELCEIVVQRFCEPQAESSSHASSRRRPEPRLTGAGLSLLLKALLASDSRQQLPRLVQCVQQLPAAYNLDDYQVPCLIAIIPWAKKRLGSIPPAIADWLAAVRKQLIAATVQHPLPPTDWARPADLDCTCGYCAQLKAFLADATQSVGRIAAREDLRSHVIQTIGRNQCDVSHQLERRGSPFSLVLTKTDGSFQRAVKRFETDLKLLRELPSPPATIGQ